MNVRDPRARHKAADPKPTPSKYDLDGDYKNPELEFYPDGYPKLAAYLDRRRRA